MLDAIDVCLAPPTGDTKHWADTQTNRDKQIDRLDRVIAMRGPNSCREAGNERGVLGTLTELLLGTLTELLLHWST